MKIMVLENDPKELTLIQQALNGKRTELIKLGSIEQAWPYVQSGESRFLIANWDTSDLRTSQFIPRARAAKLDVPVYIVLTTAKNTDDESVPTGADDIVQRPFKPADLKNKVGMAERIISLASSLASARNQLENQAAYDELTGFMNRAAFFKQSAGELERSRRASMSVSLIALDIDNFKGINETFGAELGDEVLRVLSQTIREKSRPYDCICRWESDEFVVMLAGVIGADAEKVAERIIAGIRGTRIEVESKTSVNVKLSAGIASVARVTTSTEVEPLIQQAFQAMARAKEAGGNQVFMSYV
ncbi:MAG: diguanylate cyclase [Chloroflexi bacterium]|jgi:diguanylate cyclase (GGDEF)-like protein|nr:diguanylate cyclase [Chloroflexota bacterium]